MFAPQFKASPVPQALLVLLRSPALAPSSLCSHLQGEHPQGQRGGFLTKHLLRELSSSRGGLSAWLFLCCLWDSACAGSSSPARTAVTGVSRGPWGRDLMTPCSGFPFSKTWLEMPPSLSQRTRLGEDDALRGSREHRLPLWDGATCSSSEKPKENHFISHSSIVNNLFS